MNLPAIATNTQSPGGDVGLPLRLAQRAFAALLEARRGPAAAFRLAQLRSAARRTLSALSADDHTQLQRWLGLQLASGKAQAADAVRLFARIDAMLAAQVGAALTRTREELSVHAAGAAA
ncbi:hypothetical protein [Dokdonella sp.]|uniref:hypothetical protein n=1 Tax=Dokdonella sp. TaxID=2291710 RepID=UPI001B1B8407|nr:hypothetical protein [Dokdonella sp.]MBO9664317.1 hypothetical protein [Dokdonella sp.]